MTDILDRIAYLDLIAEDTEYAMEMNLGMIDIIAGEDEIIDV